LAARCAAALSFERELGRGQLKTPDDSGREHHVDGVGGRGGEHHAQGQQGVDAEYCHILALVVHGDQARGRVARFFATCKCDSRALKPVALGRSDA
jgi:hypothetical protein